MLKRKEKRSAAKMAGENPNLINITVKFSEHSIPISISFDSTVKDLKFLLQSDTDILARGQKLIFKGNLLIDSMTLRQSEVVNGTKIMLVGTQGLKQDDARILNDLDEEKCRTGVIALAGYGLDTMPENVIWRYGNETKLLALDDNYIENFPTNFGFMFYLEKLHLDKNYLSNQSTNWGRITEFDLLTVITLSQNRLMTLPTEICVLSKLKQLDVSSNKLTSLPRKIGRLMNLEVLKANNNRLCTLPTSMGKCISLVEVDVSSNRLTHLPESLSNLNMLKYLRVGNNVGLRSLPSRLFDMCSQLSTIDFHDPEITMDDLSQYAGWDGFVERQQAKQNEGADEG